MAYLLRVELPDVPGSLGALATALGNAGADIEAIEIVEHRKDGIAVDDVLLEIPSTVMADALVTACHTIAGVSVHWISRYNAGANLSMDLEAVESFTNDPEHALERLVDVIPDTFRMDWAMAVHQNGGMLAVIHETAAAPQLVAESVDWLTLETATVLPEVRAWDSTVLAAVPGSDRSGRPFVFVVGRHGGPDVLTSELARLAHMVGLAASVQTV